MLSSNKLLDKFYQSTEHPYRTYENTIHSILKNDDCLLDAGCGRTTPILKKFFNDKRQCIGVDLEECTDKNSNLIYLQSNIEKIDIANNSVDVVISRAVLEHVQNPIAVFREINRILKPGGKFISLIPNIGDYVSVISLIIPNKYHSYIVSRTEGREIKDVFPTYYRANSYRAIYKLSLKSGFQIKQFDYLNQYPSSFMFSPYFFLIGLVYEKLTSKFNILSPLRSWILFVLEKNK